MLLRRWRVRCTTAAASSRLFWIFHRTRTRPLVRMWRSALSCLKLLWVKLLLLLVVMMVMMTASSCTTTTTPRTFRRSIRMWRRMTTVRRWTVTSRNAGRRTRRRDEGASLVSSLVMWPRNSLACKTCSNQAFTLTNLTFQSLPGLGAALPLLLPEDSFLTLWASGWLDDASLLLLPDALLSDDVMAEALTPGCCITRFRSLDGHLLKIARNSTVNSSNISNVTVLSTYVNQSLPSALCGIYGVQL